jgi:hypothetical protein
MPLCGASQTQTLVVAHRQFLGLDVLNFNTTSNYRTSFVKLPPIARYTAWVMPATLHAVSNAVLSGIAWPIGLPPAIMSAWTRALDRAVHTMNGSLGWGHAMVAPPGTAVISNQLLNLKWEMCIEVVSPLMAGAGGHVGAALGTYHFSLSYTPGTGIYTFIHLCRH